MPTATAPPPASTTGLDGVGPDRPTVPAPVHTGHADIPCGRDAEGAAVRRVLDDAREGRGAALVIHGEPGAGRSALLDHAVVHAAGMTVLRATGIQAEAGLAYAGAHQLLGPVLDRIDALPEPQAWALRTAFGWTRGRHEPFIVSTGLLTLVARVADDAPLLLVVDDLQWLDPPSASALAFVARRLHTEPVAMLLATRTRPDRATPPRGRGLSHLPLNGLPPVAAAAVLDRHLPAGVPSDVRRRLLALAGGNPLALRELPDALTPAQLSGRAMLPDPVAVTAAVEEAFLDGVGDVSPGTRTLLLVAAAERAGDVDLVVRAGAALGCGPAALAEAEGSGLLTVTRGAVRFRHPLVRAAVYSNASRTARQAAHVALAAELRAAADSDRRAWHRAAATIGRDDEVAADLELSADRAMRRGGHASAATILELAAERSTRSADVARRLVAAGIAAWSAGHVARVRTLVDRAAGRCDDPAALADIELLRAHCERADGTAGRACDILIPAADRIAAVDRRRALAMTTTAGIAAWGRNDGRRLTAAADRVAALVDGNAPMPTPAHALRAFAHAFRSEVGTAVGCTDRAVAVSEVSGSAADLWMAGVAAMAVGDDLVSLRLLRAAHARARGDGAVAVLVEVLASLAMVQAWTGHVGGARADATEGLTLARRSGLGAQRSLCDAALAWIAAVSGDEDEGVERAVRAAQRGLDHELAPAVAIAGWARGLAALGVGRLDDAHAHLADLVRQDVRTSHPMITAAAAGDIVEAAVAVGDQATARAAMAVVVRLADGSGQPWARAVAARCRALTSPTGGDDAAFTAALGHHAQGSRPLEHGRTLLAYGGWLRRQKRRIDARVHLRAALHTFERLGAVDWEDRARRELRASGHTAGWAVPVALDALTPQEVQVVRFVRTGATNKQIAARLYLSPRTIDYHLRKVFVKLGVSSRTELIARTADLPER